jgi:hypothetical protein
LYATKVFFFIKKRILCFSSKNDSILQHSENSLNIIEAKKETEAEKKYLTKTKGRKEGFVKRKGGCERSKSALEGFITTTNEQRKNVLKRPNCDCLENNNQKRPNSSLGLIL